MMQTQDSVLKERALKVVPNGMFGHLSVKMQSPRTPQYYKRAKGAYLWDYDDHRYIDYMCAFGPNLFGYSHDEIDAAYVEQLREIDTATGPSARMIELAEGYAEQVSHCDWTMFCKNGTDATTMALMTARAHRGKRKILLATGAYHGATKWCTPMPEGTLPEDRAHHIYYEYNNPDSLRAAVEEAGDDLAGIFATPFKHEVIFPQLAPNVEYARLARQLCDEKDALLILDDVRAGFRLDRDCSWESIGIRPDLSSWGKTLANGHALSCLMGSDRAKEAAGKIFVTGSFWMGAASMAAGLKTLELIRTTDYIERTVMLGDRLREGLEQVSKDTGVPIDQTGPSQMPLIMINDDEGNRNLPACVAFCDGLLDHGVFFHPFHNMFITPAMSEDDIDRTIEGCHAVAKLLPSMKMPELVL